MFHDNNKLFRDSVVVTGTHYSMSTLIGEMLGCAKEFNVIHEPLNAQPTLGYNAIGATHWYEYYDESRYYELRNALIRYMHGANFIELGLRRVLQIRRRKDILKIGKYALTNLHIACRPRRAVFKDPFLVFSGYLLQRCNNLHVVLCLRHPCAFAESLKRRGNGFDFSNLADQPTLMALFPREDAARVSDYAQYKRPVLDQAALLWRVVYGFAAAQYLDHPRTVVVRQEEVAENAEVFADRLFAAVGASRTSALDAFLRQNLGISGVADFSQDGRRSYFKRDAKLTTEKWRSRLTPEEIGRVKEIVGETAAVYGYDMP